MTDLKTSRRAFIHAGLSAAGALVIGVVMPSCAGPEVRKMRYIAEKSGKFHPNAWITITPANDIYFTLDRVEMGQGTMTSHGMLVAEELEVDPAILKVHLAGADRKFDHTVFNLQITGGSTSVVSSWEALRKAAASARVMLVEAAARRWDVGEGELKVENGTVIHRKTGRRLTYGQLTRDAAKLSIPDVELKKPKQFKVIGKSVDRLDARIKVDGTATFGIDVKVPGALNVAMIRPPDIGGKIKSFDAKDALKQKGVRYVIETPRGVAIIADKYWQALAAKDLVSVQWSPGPISSIDTDKMRAQMERATRSEGKSVRDEGKWDELSAKKNKKYKFIDVAYDVPYLAHATLEPQNCTAHFRGDSCEVWAPTQGPGLARDVVAALTGLPKDKIRVNQTLLGGGFGRRLVQDYVAEAVYISRAIKKPVKVIWSRDDDTQHAYYRPQTFSRMRGAVDKEGNIVGWSHRLVGQSIMAQSDWVSSILPDWIPTVVRVMLSDSSKDFITSGLIADPTSIEGANELPYSIPNLKVEYYKFLPRVPVGFWRSVGHSGNAFVVESFFDELAHMAGVDPYQARRKLLKKHPRNLKVLDTVAKKANWGNAPKGIYQGIAQHASFGGFGAHVVELSYPNGKDQPFKIERVVSAIDCGMPINPDIIRAQIEGAVVFGLSAAMYQHITFQNGGVQQGNFDTYPLLRMYEMPKVEVHIIQSDKKPVGVGETGLPPIAPALTNAIFAATGKRIRKLPIYPPDQV